MAILFILIMKYINDYHILETFGTSKYYDNCINYINNYENNTKKITIYG
jgi:hypothetical protein